MGKLKVIKAGMMASVQDKGRFGFRQYGIPQSGAMDLLLMKEANYLVNNPENYPVIEFAMTGMKLEVVSSTIFGVVGAELKVNDVDVHGNVLVHEGDMIKISKPYDVYGYLALGGLVKAREDFGSFSTYAMAGFGGRSIEDGDVLETTSSLPFEQRSVSDKRTKNQLVEIRIMKGPEWSMLQELPVGKEFTVDPSSNRMGVRLTGANLKCDGAEIISSAVLPGTIQLPASGEPIVLMNDCGTTGGYPRIGKVIEEDMRKLAQLAHTERVIFVMV